MRFAGRLSGLRYGLGMNRLGITARRNSVSKSTSKVSISNNIKSLIAPKTIKNPLADISTNTYDKIGTGVKNASAHANKLLNTAKGNLFDSKEKPDKAIISEITAFVSDYNSLMTTMQNSGSNTYKGYAQDIKNQVMKNGTLSEVGIAYKSDGLLEIDSKKLEAADIGKLKSLFNSKDGLAAQISNKISDVGKRVELDKIISSYDSGQLKGLSYKV